MPLDMSVAIMIRNANERISLLIKQLKLILQDPHTETMALFIEVPMETAQINGSAKLQESKETCAIVKGRTVRKREQDKAANDAAKRSIVRHLEQIYTNIEAYKTSNTARKNKFLIPESQEGLHSFEQAHRVAGQEFLHSRASLSSGKAPLYIKPAGAKTLHASHESKPNSDSSDYSGEGGVNVYNMPIRSHRYHTPGTQYFNQGIIRREMWQLQRIDPDEWDDETDMDESMRGYNSEGGEPPAPPPTRDGVPLLWERHQDLIVWTSRGTAEDVRSKIQYLYKFSPPISEEFLLGRLNGRFAPMHLEFLFRYLPGESGTIQQARDRIVMQTRGVIDRDIIAGRQAIQIPSVSYHDPDYQVPPMPGNAPADWEPKHDAILQRFIGKHPTDFLEECELFLANGACIEFLQIRMAQSMHICISMDERGATLSMMNENREVRDWVSRRNARG